MTWKYIGGPMDGKESDLPVHDKGVELRILVDHVEWRYEIDHTNRQFLFKEWDT